MRVTGATGFVGSAVVPARPEPRLTLEPAPGALAAMTAPSTVTPTAPRAEELTIAEAAERLGLSADALRYYEKDGLLLQPVRRSASGHRRYGPDDLRWVLLLTCLRGTGMTIRDVRRYADLVRAGAGNEKDRRALLKEHRRTVLARLAQIQDHLGAIDHKIGTYTEALERRPGTA